MSGEREELIEKIDALTDAEARTLLGWLAMMRRKVEPFSGQQSVGPLGDLLGMATVARERGRCTMELTVDPALHNPNGVVHGGVIYTLIDYSMGGAVQPSLPEGRACTSIEVKVSYLAPVREGTVIVETEVIRQGRNIAFLESKVRDAGGRLVATGTGSMFIFDVRQD